jgi:hypothetical protein
MRRFSLAIVASLSTVSTLAHAQSPVRPKCFMSIDNSDPRGPRNAASPNPDKWPTTSAGTSGDFGDVFSDRINILVNQTIASANTPDDQVNVQMHAKEIARQLAAEIYRRKTLYGTIPIRMSIVLQNFAGVCDDFSSQKRFTSLIVNTPTEYVSPAGGWPTDPLTARYTQPWLAYARTPYYQGGTGLAAWSYWFGHHLATFLKQSCTPGPCYKDPGAAFTPAPLHFHFDIEDAFLTSDEGGAGSNPWVFNLLAVKNDARWTSTPVPGIRTLSGETLNQAYQRVQSQATVYPSSQTDINNYGFTPFSYLFTGQVDDPVNNFGGGGLNRNRNLKDVPNAHFGNWYSEMMLQARTMAHRKAIYEQIHAGIDEVEPQMTLTPSNEVMQFSNYDSVFTDGETDSSFGWFRTIGDNLHPTAPYVFSKTLPRALVDPGDLSLLDWRSGTQRAGRYLPHSRQGYSAGSSDGLNRTPDEEISYAFYDEARQIRSAPHFYAVHQRHRSVQVYEPGMPAETRWDASLRLARYQLESIINSNMEIEKADLTNNIVTWTPDALAEGEMATDQPGFETDTDFTPPINSKLYHFSKDDVRRLFALYRQKRIPEISFFNISKAGEGSPDGPKGWYILRKLYHQVYQPEIQTYTIDHGSEVYPTYNPPLIPHKDRLDDTVPRLRPGASPIVSPGPLLLSGKYERYEVPIQSAVVGTPYAQAPHKASLTVEFKNVNGKLQCRNGALQLAPDEPLCWLEIYTESRTSIPGVEGHLFVMLYDVDGSEKGWVELYADDPTASNRGFRCTVEDPALFPSTENDIRRRFLTSNAIFQLEGSVYRARSIIRPAGPLDGGKAGQVKVRLSYVNIGPVFGAFEVWQNLVQVVRNDDYCPMTPIGEESMAAPSSPPSDLWGADYNLADGITLDDTVNFLTDWASEAPLSDLNGDGNIDAADLALFVDLTAGS